MRKNITRAAAAGVVTLVAAGIVTVVLYSNNQEKMVPNANSQSSNMVVEDQSGLYEIDLEKVHCPFDGYVEKYKVDNNLTELNADQQYDLFDTMFINGETPDKFADCNNEYLEAYKEFYAERLAEQKAMEAEQQGPTETEKPTETEGEAEQTQQDVAFPTQEDLHEYVEKQFGAEAADVMDWAINKGNITLEQVNKDKKIQGEWFESVIEGDIETQKTAKEQEENRKPPVDPEVTKESLKRYKETGSVQG